jgi:hypothetical protein
MKIVLLLVLSPRGSAPRRKQLEEGMRRRREESKFASSGTNSSDRSHEKKELNTVIDMAR